MAAFVAASAITACGSSGTAVSAPSTAVSAPSTPVYRFGVVGTRGKIPQLQVNTPTEVTGISGKVVQIASSNSDGYALTSNGSVYAWGVGNYGELGDGRAPHYVNNAVRVDFPLDARITALANPMPFDGALAIDSHGDAWGWGLNIVGDLCLRGAMELVPEQLPLTRVTAATGARTHSLFDSNGHVYGCGSGSSGELGNGSTSGSTTPTEVVGLPSTSQVTALTSSWAGSGALMSDGSYYNWGYNAGGQLGNGSTANSDVPVRVNLPDRVREVSQGGSAAKNGQTVAILANGSVWSWGDNMQGQLGNGSRISSDVPVAVSVPAGVSFVEVDSGGYSSYAIDSSGRLWAWGGNNNGQLGTGSAKRLETTPVDVGLHLTQVSSTATNVAAFDQR